MASIDWSEEASADVEAIALFIARDSPKAADAFVARLNEAVDRAAIFPYSGRVVPEFDSEAVREVLVGMYRVIYLIRGETVAIVTVVHGARLLS